MTDTHKDESKRLNAQLKEMAERQFADQMGRATALLTQGNGKDAIPLLERCRDLRPDDVNVLTNLGGAYILAGRHRHAVPLLERATELAPNNPHVWSNLAAAYLGKLVTATSDKQHKALAAYQRVLELDAAYPNVHYNIGLIHVDRREWDAAYDAFTRALHHNPDDRDAQSMRAKVETIRSRPANPGNN